MNPNYSKMLEKEIQRLDESGAKPRLLLHSCCAPCSSYCLTYLADHFKITAFYYNPNITISSEYEKRVNEEERLINILNFSGKLKYEIDLVKGRYEPEVFLEAVKGHEEDKEGTERCFICYALRLNEAAFLAFKGGFDYFTTTLTISPLKNAEKLNEIGRMCGEKYGVAFLASDFKKNEGYKRSIELSKEYDLYRQNYCGCEFSKKRDGEER